MSNRFDIKPNLIKSIPHLFDTLLLLILGMFLILRDSDYLIIFLGICLCLLGLVLYVRRINGFHLFEDKLLIKKLLFPFRIADKSYFYIDILEIKFHKIKGRFGGSFVTVKARQGNSSYCIEVAEEMIEKFDLRLKEIGIKTIRDGL